MPAKKTTKSDPLDDFEASMARLDEIVNAIEEEKLPLSELMVQYEQGIKLHKQCEALIAVAKERLETITKANQESNSQDTPSTPAPSPSNDDDEIRLF